VTRLERYNLKKLQYNVTVLMYTNRQISLAKPRLSVIVAIMADVAVLFQ